MDFSSLFLCYSHYMEQVIHGQGRAFTHAIEAYPALATSLGESFFSHFDPKKEKSPFVWPPLPELPLEIALLFQAWQGWMEKTVRTNAYCPEAKTFAIKLVHEHGMIEIFVYHPLFQGVFLKSHLVARGGLRFSDRHDFREECLQLLSTQVLKNTGIVPAGAKGAFYLFKHDPSQVRPCYSLFVQSILELSDNYLDKKIVSPPFVQCYDGEDFYYVVAADKGTAFFSDEANTLSLEKGYWLGDGFASGGSYGYNHKKLAITSRGAWISVHHHLSSRTESKPLKIVGIGDMAGDIFGNGMLLERSLLLAAFNHEAIFIDPNPDLDISYQERCRLFHLPHSSWHDYRAFSKGGGVFSRKETSLFLSPEAQALLGLSQPHAHPNEVILHMLKLPVDLLWMGGIGTFVKGYDQEAVQDPSNEAIRLCGHDVRAGVVAEGANLGFTQEGRIAYALSGGKINTDGIDNAAGVTCSDYEINIKILLDSQVAQGLLSQEERNDLLQKVASEVCHLVLNNNHWHNLVISYAQQQGSKGIEAAIRLIKAIPLPPSVSFSSSLWHERLSKNGSLVRPEIATLMACSKMHTRNLLKKISLKGQEQVLAYFPALLREEFYQVIPHHLLYQQLQETILTNHLIHLCGPWTLNELALQCGYSLADTTAAALEFYNCFHGFRMVQKIESLFSHPKQIYPLLSLFVLLLEKVVTYGFSTGKSISDLSHATLPKESKSLYEEYYNSFSYLAIP